MNSAIISEYRDKLKTDGVVQIGSLFDQSDLRELDVAIDDNMRMPSPFGGYLQKKETGGSFFMDFNNWNRITSIYDFIKKEKISSTIKGITGSHHGRLFHDSVLVKEGASIATPWHHDRPYYIFKGDLNLSIWIPSTDVGRESSLIFWAGSHKNNAIYMPKGFADGKSLGDDDTYEELNSSFIPQDKIIDFEMKAGDALVFFNNTVHGSKPHNGNTARRALSIRMLLDGARLTKKYVNATPPFDRMGVKIVEDGEVPERFPELW
jgi:ectoine hydroxylase-related dioxygenase (phytanoyl-CoA dioxygenase family)